MANQEPKIDLRDIGLKARNLKCFGDEPQGFDRILPINVIIGRNNSGKSALLDLVENAFGKAHGRWRGRLGNEPVAVVERQFVVEDAKCIRHETVRQTYNYIQLTWEPRTHAESHLPGRRLSGILNLDKSLNDVALKVIEGEDTENSDAFKANEICKKLSGRLTSGLKGYRFRRLLADRDVAPETQATPGQLSISPAGVGATACIESLLHHETEDQRLVERDLLNALNSIFSPEHEFMRIVAQRNTAGDEQVAAGVWELQLYESNGVVVPLSQTGSGLKTVLLVLANLLVAPKLRQEGERVALPKWVFAFEELENNLHPAIQRRLFAYIQKFAKQHRSTFFITTHSNVVIDFFSQDQNAQLIHVTRQDDESKAKTVSLSNEHGLVLDDLGVRASDLLQTNVVIWVEGPSDRIYVNRWIELLTGGKLKQGLHYQCVFYGGSVLKHFTMDDDGSGDDLIEALKVCRRAVLIADSDRSKADDELKERVQRVVNEANEAGCLTWVTQGREVENYLPKNVLSELLGDEAKKAKSLYSIVPNAFKSKTKVAIAREAVDCESMTEESIRGTLDLGDRLDGLIEYIRVANGLEA